MLEHLKKRKFILDNELAKVSQCKPADDYLGDRMYLIGSINTIIRLINEIERGIVK